MPDALVAGVGAVGGWLLARLAQGGADVTGWARGETYRRLAAGEPLTMRSGDGDWSGPVTVVDRPTRAYDLTFVCVKSDATAGIAAEALPGGIAVSVQNGLDNPSVLAGGPWDRVVPTVVYSGCVRTDPVTITHTSNGYLVLDDAEVAGWLSAHGVRVEQVDDLRPWQWRKLTGNVVQNSLTALLDSRIGPIRDHPALAHLQRRLCEEVAAVAHAEGVDLGPDFATRVLAGFGRLPPWNGTSMLWDRRAGRPFEVDALSGAVLRRAASHGIEVPVVETIDALVRFVSDTASGAVTQPDPAGPNPAG
jgi:2-dehydropantoate 2-reductase